MSALTDYAKNKPCLIRAPNICTFQDEQTVACHVPLMDYHGTGLKMADFFIAFGCFNCHDLVDRRRYKHIDETLVRIWHVEGMIRTQAYILKHAPHLVVNLARAA
jgi:hypothetical protein